MEILEKLKRIIIEKYWKLPYKEALKKEDSTFLVIGTMSRQPIIGLDKVFAVMGSDYEIHKSIETCYITDGIDRIKWKMKMENGNLAILENQSEDTIIQLFQILKP